MKLKYAIVIVILAALSGCTENRGDAEKRLQEWKHRLSQELGAGASQPEIEQFFSRHSLDYGFSASDRTINAIDRDVETSGLVSTSIRIACTLDSSMRLVACKAEPVLTGP